MSNNDELSLWRRRLRTARQLADILASGRQLWMRGEVLYVTPLDRGPGLVVYGFDRRTGLFSIRHRIIGLALADLDTN